MTTSDQRRRQGGVWGLKPPPLARRRKFFLRYIEKNWIQCQKWIIGWVKIRRYCWRRKVKSMYRCKIWRKFCDFFWTWLKTRSWENFGHFLYMIKNWTWLKNSIINLEIVLDMIKERFWTRLKNSDKSFPKPPSTNSCLRHWREEHARRHRHFSRLGILFDSGDIVQKLKWNRGYASLLSRQLSPTQLMD